jgi:ATP-dependent DNA helicase RecQ
LVPDNEGHGSLFLAESSRTLLKGQQTVLLRQQPEFQKASKKLHQVDGSFSSDPAAHGLWVRLRAWRTDVARTHGVPAYVVFHDATLKELVRICPQTEDELRLVSGVGAHKLERYGEDLIEILRGI